MFGLPATAPLGGIVLATTITVVAAAAVGVVYGYALSSLPFVHIFTLMAAPAFGLMIAVAADYGFKLGRVRHSAVGLTIVMIGAAFGFYASWVASLSVRFSVAEVVPLAGHPLVLLEVIAELNEVGPWRVGNLRPTGVALWILWLIEAGCIFGMARTTAITRLQALNDRPFCPACNRWVGQAEPVANFGRGTGDPDDLRQHLRDRDWEHLASLGISYDVNHGHRLWISRCKCGSLQCATLERNTRRPDSGGDRALLLKDTRLTADEVQRLHAAASNAHPPPVPRRRGVGIRR